MKEDPTATSGRGKSRAPHKMELGELEAHVARLELEVRELDAREKLRELKSRIVDQRASSGRGQNKKKAASA